MVNLKFLCLLGFFHLSVPVLLFAQEIPPADSAVVSPVSAPSPIDSLSIDSLSLQSLDSAHLAGDSLKAEPKKSTIETTIIYSAKDSINFDVVNKIVSLYGDAKITYGTIELEAAEVDINYQTHVMKARGVTDSTGKAIGKPIFKDGGQTYYTDEITYNFKTKKAISKGVVTEQGDANMRGNTVFKNEKNEMFVKHAIYTTCNRPEPHFHIQTERIKLIPNNKIVSGPGFIAVKGIPTPIGFPFGIFPMPNKKSSGVVMPTYGEEKRRGFSLRNGGYYFALSEYADLEILGEIYSKGSWGLNLSSSYLSRYKFNGFLNMRYNNQKALSEVDSTVMKDFWLNWSHTPKSVGASRFSASLNLGTSSYNQNNPTINLANTIQQNFNSSISYSTNFRRTPFSLSARGRFQQNVNTKEATLLLPELSLNMSRVNPLKNVGSKSDAWYKKLNFSYSMNSSNRMTNSSLRRPSGYNVANLSEEMADSVIAFSTGNLPTLWQRSQNGMQHRIPVSTTLKLFKFFTLNPSFSYDETWYFKKLDYTFIPEQNAVRIDTLQEFSRFYRYSGGASLNTNIYGTVYLKKGYVRAIRHVMRPNVSMSLSPDLSADRFDYFKEMVVDTAGTVRQLSRYEGFLYGTPTAGQSATMSFSLSNNLEMKVKSKKDTVNEFTKVAIFENLNVSSNYNFLADSFKLGNFNLGARTKLFNKRLDVNFSTTIDPYYWELDSMTVNRSGDPVAVQRRRDIYAWNSGNGIGQLSSARLGLTINFRPKGAKETSERMDEIDQPLTPEEELVRDFIKYNPDLYVDFNIPWSLNLNYNLNYTKQGHNPARIVQGLQMSGQITLTEQWNIGFNSGYDFVAKQITQTSVRASRDMHCWQMSFNWVPFGRYQSYHLTINAKSSLLQDLKVNRQRTWWDR